MKVLLVDDQTLFLEGLYNILEANGYDVVGRAEDGIEALTKVRLLKPELVLMDIQMEGCDGIKATKLIKAEIPGIKIVILTIIEEDNFLFEAVRSGVSGYLLKKLEAEKFISLLSRIKEGEPAFAPGMLRKIFREFSRLSRIEQEGREIDKRCLKIVYNNLTPRQKQIFSLVTEGKTYREIGKILAISESTVKNHMGKIFAHLNVENKAGVMAYGRNTGIFLQNQD